MRNNIIFFLIAGFFCLYWVCFFSLMLGVNNE